MQESSVLDDESYGVEVDTSVVSEMKSLRGWSIGLCIGSLVVALLFGAFAVMLIGMGANQSFDYDRVLSFSIFVTLAIAFGLGANELRKLVKRIEVFLKQKTQTKLLPILKTVKGLFRLLSITVLTIFGILLVANLIDFIFFFG